MHRAFVFLQISLLSESSRTLIAAERLGLDMLSEVVPDVARLLEYFRAAIILTSIILFVFIGICVEYFDNFNHVFSNSFQLIFFIPSNDAVLILHFLSI